MKYMTVYAWGYNINLRNGNIYIYMNFCRTFMCGRHICIYIIYIYEKRHKRHLR